MVGQMALLCHRWGGTSSLSRRWGRQGGKKGCGSRWWSVVITSDCPGVEGNFRVQDYCGLVEKFVYCSRGTFVFSRVHFGGTVKMYGACPRRGLGLDCFNRSRISVGCQSLIMGN